uniref:Uncharacterized protein n=1 Tax=Setaria italica TaxID=4555 RepID=K3Y4E9_SETIT
MCSCDPQMGALDCFRYPEGDRGLPTYLMWR